ncbi:hypothetical protein [Sinobacterium norvegicum]|nr:hypothetical protein [Sinobacterium norvegicum]
MADTDFPQGVYRIELFAHQRCAQSAVPLVKDKKYRLTVVAKSRLQDSDIVISRPPAATVERCQDHTYSDQDAEGAIDETGFCNQSLSTSTFMSHFKQSKNHEWFELIVATDECAKDSMIAVSDMSKLTDQPASYQFTATKSGNFSGFVNDAGWFYGNNKGYLLLELEAVQ